MLTKYCIFIVVFSKLSPVFHPIISLTKLLANNLLSVLIPIKSNIYIFLMKKKNAKHKFLAFFHYFLVEYF